MSKKTINIRLDSGACDEIKLIADQNHRSLTNQITVWVVEQLERNSKHVRGKAEEDRLGDS